MATLENLEREMEQIRERNTRVETDKAWETSKTRKIIIIFATYIIIALFLTAANIPDPWLNAIVPALAFAVSTLSFPYFKRMWLKYIYGK